LIVFLLSGGFSTELVTLPNHIEFAAEEDFPSISRQDEAFKSSSRKRNARGRKVNLAHTRILTPLLWVPEGRISSRQSAASPPLNQQLHQLHKVFRI
jgi:hypothetical protein